MGKLVAVDVFARALDGSWQHVARVPLSPQCTDFDAKGVVVDKKEPTTMEPEPWQETPAVLPAETPAAAAAALAAAAAPGDKDLAIKFLATCERCGFRFDLETHASRLLARQVVFLIEEHREHHQAFAAAEGGA